MCAAPVAPEWAERSSELSTAWMTWFGKAVLSCNSENMKGLFHPMAVIFGGEKHGPCDVLQASTFRMDANSAKIMPCDKAYSLVLVEWFADSPIKGAPTHKGFATFLLYINEPDGDRKGDILCVHAHFSRQ